MNYTLKEFSKRLNETLLCLPPEKIEAVLRGFFQLLEFEVLCEGNTLSTEYGSFFRERLYTPNGEILKVHFEAGRFLTRAIRDDEDVEF